MKAPPCSLPFLTLFLLLNPSSAHADLSKGLQAAREQRWEEAYKEFKGPAAAGNSNAQVNLGNLYFKGLGVAQSDNRAFDWFEKAALQGNVLGESKLAILYFYGLSVPADHREAAEWFLKAAEQGDAGAARILADLYSHGDGVEKSPEEAYLWASVAAELGHPGGEALRNELASTLPPTDLNRALTRLNQWREEQDRRVQDAAPRALEGPQEPLAPDSKSTIKHSSQTSTKASPLAKTKTHPATTPKKGSSHRKRTKKG